MDRNYMLYRHQVELMRAQAAHSETARLAHSALAHGYAKIIADDRRALFAEAERAGIPRATAIA